MAHQESDNEYERLFALDNAEETGDPWKVLRYGEEGEPIGDIIIEIQKPIRRRLVQSRVGQIERVPKLCNVCLRRQTDCICLIG